MHRFSLLELPTLVYYLQTAWSLSNFLKISKLPSHLLSQTESDGCEYKSEHVKAKGDSELPLHLGGCLRRGQQVLLQILVQMCKAPSVTVKENRRRNEKSKNILRLTRGFV